MATRKPPYSFYLPISGGMQLTKAFLDQSVQTLCSALTYFADSDTSSVKLFTAEERSLLRKCSQDGDEMPDKLVVEMSQDLKESLLIAWTTGFNSISEFQQMAQVIYSGLDFRDIDGLSRDEVLRIKKVWTGLWPFFQMWAASISDQEDIYAKKEKSRQLKAAMNLVKKAGYTVMKAKATDQNKALLAKV